VEEVYNAIDVYKDKSYTEYKNYERFKFMLTHMEDSLNEASSLLDIGCAKGEYISALQEIYPKIEYTGIEYSTELVEIANKHSFLKEVTITQGDVTSLNLDKEFDITVLAGVLSIFDDFETPLLNMIKHTKKNGQGFIFGGFNSDDIDVRIKYKNNYLGSTEWESGWNILSLSTISKFLEDHVSKFEINKFQIDQDLSKQDNPVTSYTKRLNNGENIILTGGNIVRDFYLISFTK